jgi:hypothetical protein
MEIIVTPEIMDWSFFPSIIFVVLSSVILGYFVYGWIFSTLRQAFINKKIDLLGGLGSSVPMGLRFFLISMAALIAFMTAVLAAAIFMGITALISSWTKLLGAILAVFGIILYIVVLILFLSIILQIVPVLILDSKGVIATIKTGIAYYKKNFKQSLALFFISAIVLAISYAPVLILFLIIGFNEYQLMSVSQSWEFYLYTIPASLPAVIAFMWVLIFNTLSYQKTR